MNDGIYFGMELEAYLAEERLSSSGIKQLLVHPLHFWAHSWMNPRRPEPDDTPFTELGTAYHKRVIEGAAAFAASDEDYLIPSCVLGATVSGLVSRSILNDAVIGPGRAALMRWKPHLPAATAEVMPVSPASSVAS